MRKIKLSGREMSVIRSIDLAEGTSGADIQERTQIPPEDLVDVMNGLLDAGFLETIPPSEKVEPGKLAETIFETNPAYSTELRKVTRR
jgi:DNA-binding MarR family transcriptional regulator